MIRIMFRARYGSRTNGTAHAKSDNDILFAYQADDGDTWDIYVSDGSGEHGMRYATYLRGLRNGIPSFIDILYLPDELFEVPLCDELKGLRESKQYLGETAAREYRAVAKKKRNLALERWPNEWGRKCAYQSLLFARNASRVAEMNPPLWYDPDLVQTLRDVRYGNVSQREYESLWRNLMGGK